MSSGGNTNGIFLSGELPEDEVTRVAKQKAAARQAEEREAAKIRNKAIAQALLIKAQEAAQHNLELDDARKKEKEKREKDEGSFMKDDVSNHEDDPPDLEHIETPALVSDETTKHSASTSNITVTSPSVQSSSTTSDITVTTNSVKSTISSSTSSSTKNSTNSLENMAVSPAIKRPRDQVDGANPLEPDTKSNKTKSNKPEISSNPPVAVEEPIIPVVDIRSTQEVNDVIANLKMQSQMEWQNTPQGKPPPIPEHYMVSINYGNGDTHDSDDYDTPKSSLDEMD